MVNTEELRKLLKGTSQGEWSIPHLAIDNTSCDCTYILSDEYAGSIASVSVDNGKPVSDGGNDCPPIAEAKANAVFMATFNPSTVSLLLDIIDSKQAEIDALMLEFCPDEMTQGQLEVWSRHQRVSDYQPPQDEKNLNPWVHIKDGGQPKTSGFYDVLYGFENNDDVHYTFYYDGTLWYNDVDNWYVSLFGNHNVSGEKYRKSNNSEIVIHLS